MLLQVVLCGYYVVACVEFVGKAQRSILSDIELAGNGSDGGVERVDLAVEQVDFLVGRDELLPQAVDFLNLRINLNAQGFDSLGELLVVDGGIAEPRLELLKLLLTLLDFLLEAGYVGKNLCLLPGVLHRVGGRYGHYILKLLDLLQTGRNLLYQGKQLVALLERRGKFLLGDFLERLLLGLPFAAAGCKHRGHGH